MMGEPILKNPKIGMEGRITEMLFLLMNRTLFSFVFFSLFLLSFVTFLSSVIFFHIGIDIYEPK